MDNLVTYKMAVPTVNLKNIFHIFLLFFCLFEWTSLENDEWTSLLGFNFMSLFFLGICFDLTHFGLTSNLIYDEVISRKKLKLTRAQFAPFSSTSVSVLVSYYQVVPLPPVDLWPNLSNFSIRNWIESKTSWFDKFFLKFPHPFLVKYLREQSTDARFSRQNSKFKFCNWMKNIHKSYYVT